MCNRVINSEHGVRVPVPIRVVSSSAVPSVYVPFFFLLEDDYFRIAKVLYIYFFLVYEGIGGEMKINVLNVSC